MGKKGGGRNAFVKTSAVSREDAVGPAEVAPAEAVAAKANGSAGAVATDAPATSVTGVLCNIRRQPKLSYVLCSSIYACP